MLRQKYHVGIVLLFFAFLGGCSAGAPGIHRKCKDQRIHSFAVNTEKEKQWIRAVAIVTKRNRDFEYFSTIWRSFQGKPWLNRIAEDREQRYVLGIDSERDFTGTYAVILFNDSLKNLMDQGTVKVEYVGCDALKPKCVTYFLTKKHIVDDRQIFVRLNSSRSFRKKIVAWKVSIQSEEKECVQSSLFWKKLMQ
jgi:hypothetical protein